MKKNVKSKSVLPGLHSGASGFKLLKPKSFSEFLKNMFWINFVKTTKNLSFDLKRYNNLEN
jgi:hypothetical protein